MALYRFSCYGNVIDEREFYSGEEVYAHAQDLANQLGYEVDFAVMPKCDTVKPQQETEAPQDSDWERQTAEDGKLQIQTAEDEQLEIDADEDDESETEAAEDENRAGTIKAVLLSIATAIAGIVALAVFFFTQQPSTNTNKLEASDRKRTTPAPILKTEENQQRRVKATPNTIEAGDTSSSKPASLKSRKSNAQSSGFARSQNSLGGIVDDTASDDPSDDDRKPPTRRRQPTAAGTKKELPALRGKSALKSPSANQPRRQKRQGGSGSGGLKDEAASPRQSSQSPNKLPSGGY